MDLRRHELVRLTPDGWRRAEARHGDRMARRCIAHWRSHDLPVVVATQPRVAATDVVSLGLPAPTPWGRSRYALRVGSDEIVRGRDAFPALASIAPQIAAALPQALVYGSHGWQHLTGLSYVRERSDVDLWVPVADASQADESVARLLRLESSAPRLDGELVFADGAAVAWREWAAWRDGRTRSIVVKRLHGASLESDAGWIEARADVEVAS